MRDIKFRAWDGKEMLQEWLVLRDTGGGVFPTTLTRKAIVVMQFTGLNDKNGKEIYEGDIVRAKLMRGDNHTYVYPVEYVTYPAPMFAIHGRQMNDDEFEVIGNIYENPELLTK